MNYYTFNNPIEESLILNSSTDSNGSQPVVYGALGLGEGRSSA
jgi:hypothetical protein